MVGGRDYGETQFNRATKALRQPGSSFKVYTYSLAMEKGLTPTSIVVDGPVTWRGWSPQNYGRSYAGRITILTAIAKSINSIPVKLAKDLIGTEAISKRARDMGVETPIRTDKTIPLGTSELTVMDQATAYATFPAEGMQSRRHGITQIMDYQGKVLYDFNKDAPPAKRVMTKQAADYMNQMLSQIPYIGTARKAALDNGIVTAGKTGTTQGYRDAWFCGFTGNYTAAVWFGNDDYTSTNNMTGGSLPAMTFKILMDYAHQGIELKPILGIENPLPKDRPKETAAAIEAKKKAEADSENKMPELIRPRTLTAASTRLIRAIGERLKSAPPLKLPEKVAEAG
jgi:penicillin-binding protein 1A